MPLYSLLEYSQNCSMTSRSLCNYHRDKTDDVCDNASDGKSIKYKTKIVGKTPQRPEQPGNEEDADQPQQPAIPNSDVEFTFPLKYLSNFWRVLALLLINYGTKLFLSCTKGFALIKHHNNIRGTTFMTTSTKLYVPVVTLSINNNIKFSENIK